MAKYLFCFPRFHTNAVPWVRVLTEGGHDVSIHVVLAATTESYDLVKPIRIQYSRLSKWVLKHFPGKGVNSPRAFPPVGWYWRVLTAEDPEIVVVRDLSRWFSLLAAIVARVQHRRVVVYDQEPACPVRMSRQWWKRKMAAVLGFSQFTTRLSPLDSVAQCMEAGVIPFGLPSGGTRTEQPRGTRRAAKPRLLMVAKFRKRKGHKVLIDALALIREARDFELTICGEEACVEDRLFRGELERYVAAKGLRGRIVFVVNVKYADMNKLYREHDLFVLPSTNEPAAVSPIEAASNGCAVLISRESGTRGYLPSGAKYEIDPHSCSSIANRIDAMISDTLVLESAKRQCLSSVLSLCADQQVLTHFESLLSPSRVRKLQRES